MADSPKEPTATELAREFVEQLVLRVIVNRIPQLAGRTTVSYEPSKHYIFEVVRLDAGTRIRIGRQFTVATRFEDLALAAYQVAQGLTSAVTIRQVTA